MLDWSAVRERYENQASVPPLRGTSRIEVVKVDDERICFRQRLWRDCLTRVALDDAVARLGDRTLPADAIAFAEELRVDLANTITGCSRTPNLSAIVLKDLGYLV